MWNFLASALQWIETALGVVGGWATTTVALIAILAAVALYVYSLITPALTKIIATPLVAILVAVGCYIYGSHNATVYEQAQCDMRFNTAQQAANDKALEAAVKIQGLEKVLNGTLVDLAEEKAKNKNDLQNAIDENMQHPSKDELPPTKTGNQDDDAPPANSQSPTTDTKTVIVQVPAKASTCLPVAVPSNILSILQRTNPTAIKSRK